MTDLCAYVLPHKGRTCRLKAAAGQLYCGEHSYFATAQGRKRVVCPVASTQYVITHMRILLERLEANVCLKLTLLKYQRVCSSVWEDELEHHIKSCSFLKEKQRSQVSTVCSSKAMSEDLLLMSMQIAFCGKWPATSPSRLSFCCPSTALITAPVIALGE